MFSFSGRAERETVFMQEVQGAEMIKEIKAFIKRIHEGVEAHGRIMSGQTAWDLRWVQLGNELREMNLAQFKATACRTCNKNIVDHAPENHEFFSLNEVWIP